MKTVYDVKGPIELPREVIEAKAGARTKFWQQDELKDIAPAIGVFVFGLRTAKGDFPHLIGVAEESFEQDTFRLQRAKAFTHILDHYTRVRPILFFVERPAKRGRVRAGELEEIAFTLLTLGGKRNPSLAMIDDEDGEAAWGIRGVVRNRAGRLSHAASAFRVMLAVDEAR